MPSPPLDFTHGRTKSGVALYNLPWTAHTVERRRAWHAIIAFGQHTRSNDVGRGMPSSPLGSTHGRTTLGVACHHRLWAAHTIERSWAWHAIIAFGQADTVRRRWAWHAIIALGRQTRSNDIRRGMQSLLWAGQTVERHWAWHPMIAFGQHRRSDGVGRRMPSSPLDSTDGRPS